MWVAECTSPHLSPYKMEGGEMAVNERAWWEQELWLVCTAKELPEQHAKPEEET